MVPTYETRITDIHHIYMEDCEIESTDAIFEIAGDVRKPVHDVYLRNLRIGKVKEFVNRVVNGLNVVTEGVVVEEGISE